MGDAISEGSLLYIALTNWGPTVFTVGVGGYLASVLFPRWQSGYQMTKQRTARKIEIAESVARNLEGYIIAWRRLIAISKLERERPLDEVEQARKAGFVTERNDLRDALFADLNVCGLYFSPPVTRLVHDFCDWDEENAVRRLDELPGIEEWRAWERRILEAMRDEMS
ncbi:MAG: hypothetical protein AAFR52_12470 [Pseudomonadota bacterium]